MTTKNDGEVSSLIWMCAIFGIALASVDIWYSAWHTMPEFFKILGYVLNGACVGLIILVFVEWKNPNFDKYRVIFCVLAVATLIYVGAFRGGSDEAKSVIDDSNKSKQEDSIQNSKLHLDTTTVIKK